MKSVSYAAGLLAHATVGLVFHCCFFLYNENTNYWTRIKQYYHSNQPCNKLQNLCSLGAAATSTPIVSFFWF